MQVLGKNVVVIASEEEKQTSGGIILSTAIETGHKKATIIARGKECKTVLKPNTVVYLNWKEAMPFEHEGVKMAVIDEEHIKVIIE